ncbi:hypothetical protein [Actinacidiphila oryziradicis]|uniref:Uncharacterized protein n=1 Tax=Actinacidiphila oryziradicis TaxID=2571141 RepID=A0A4U0SAJ2_9ACTN|nr:hypothetical protein [Actinacidiphila oryziradicis]TKA06340.1 hypothetical protein FCI23_32360 [Actinacidiphila oryziradicis]
MDTDLYEPNTYLFYPAVTLDDSNDIFLVASASSTSINPSLGLFSAQSGGTNISGSLMQTGLGPLSCTNCNNLVRYGDYSGISLDGSSLSSSVIWVAGEYGNAVSTSPSDVWGTEIGEYNY